MLGPELLFPASDAFLSTLVAHLHRQLGRPAIVGLSGAQGSGKSSTADRLSSALSAKGLSVATRSLDDFYLSHEERQRLASDIHPLLATRGVPGTHDIALAKDIIDRLCRAKPDQRTAMPMFDKAADDRVPPAQWPVHAGRADIILIEGWCVGARAQRDAMLAAPVNALERDEDREGVWRRYVNDRLKTDYAAFFGLFDLMIHLRAPSFDHVFAWRAEQEAGLDRNGDGARRAMDGAELRRFVSHYERLTRWMMEKPDCDILIDLDDQRRSRAICCNIRS